MQPIYKSYTTVGDQTPIGVSYLQAYPAISVAVYIANGGATYGIQYTLDPIDGNPRWFNDPTLPPGTTQSGVTAITWPIRGVRFTSTFLSGTVEFKLIQPEN